VATDRIYDSGTTSYTGDTLAAGPTKKRTIQLGYGLPDHDQRPGLPLYYTLAPNTYVNRSSVAQLAQRQFISGQSSERSAQTVVSEFAVTDLLGGLGIHDYDEKERVDRFWDGDCYTHIKRGITLCGLTGTPTTRFSAGTVGMQATAEYNNLLWGVSRAGVLMWWDTATDNWSTTGVTATAISGLIIGACLVVYQDVLYGVTATGYWSMPSTYTVTHNLVTGGIKSLVRFDEKLVRVTAAGQFGFVSQTTKGTAVLTTWTEPAVAVYTGGGQMVGLVIWQDLHGNAAVVWLTTDSLGIYDVASGQVYSPWERKVRKTYDALLRADQIVTWNSDLYYIQQDTVYRMSGGTVDNVGPGKDQGLPIGANALSATYRASSLCAINNWLLLGMVDLTTGVGTVLGYNGQGWHVLAKSLSAGSVPSSGFTVTYSEVGADKRLYWLNGHYTSFNDANATPLNWTSQIYATAGSLTTSYFDSGVVERPKVAYNLRVRCRDMTGTETIKVWYQVNSAPDGLTDDTTNTYANPEGYWTPLLDEFGDVTTITSASLDNAGTGVVTLYFDRPLAANGMVTQPNVSRGRVFTNIRLRFDLARGSTTTASPILEAAVMAYDAIYPPLWGFQLRLDLTKQADDRNTNQCIADLVSTIEENRLVEFAYDPHRTYLVRIDTEGLGGLETGWSPGDGPAMAELALRQRLPDEPAGL